MTLPVADPDLELSGGGRVACVPSSSFFFFFFFFFFFLTELRRGTQAPWAPLQDPPVTTGT